MKCGFRSLVQSWSTTDGWIYLLVEDDNGSATTIKLTRDDAVSVADDLWSAAGLSPKPSLTIILAVAFSGVGGLTLLAWLMR